MSRFVAKTSFEDDTFWGKLKKAASSDLDIYLAQCEAEIAQHKLHAVKLLQEAYIAEKVHAEATQLFANARITKIQGDLLNKIIEDMDFKNITSSQAYVLVKAINPMASFDVDITAKDAMVEEQLNKLKEENRMLKAQADEEVARANKAVKRHESDT